MWRRYCLGVLAVCFAAATAVGQGNYSRADIEDGGRLYRANCTNCHGPDGVGIPGVDLGHGRFRRVSSDEDLMQIIRRGIPGTPMPPTTYTEFQVKTLVAYLRSMAVDSSSSTGNGDPARGKSLFEGKAQCGTCHRVKGVGSRLGPDLTEIGTLRRTVELQRSIVDTNSEVSAANRSFRGVTKEGSVITGRFLGQDTFSLQVLDSNEHLLSLSKSNLREFNILTNSSMPAYRDKLTYQEVADLVSYLASLKGAGTQ